MRVGYSLGTSRPSFFSADPDSCLSGGGGGLSPLASGAGSPGVVFSGVFTSGVFISGVLGSSVLGFSVLVFSVLFLAAFRTATDQGDYCQQTSRREEFGKCFHKFPRVRVLRICVVVKNPSGFSRLYDILKRVAAGISTLAGIRPGFAARSLQARLPAASHRGGGFGRAGFGKRTGNFGFHVVSRIGQCINQADAQGRRA